MKRFFSLTLGLTLTIFGGAASIENDDKVAASQKLKFKENDLETKNLDPQVFEKQFSKKIECMKNNENKHLLIVSQMNGQLAAIDLKNDGKIAWNIDVGSDSFFSSSISKLEIRRNGQTTRLIPSMDGTIYQFDGESIEPLPFSADSLLSSTYRFNEDTMVVGGKKIINFGVDASSGKIQYQCDADGCKSQNGDSVSPTDMLVISRKSRTIRAVEMRNGAERWNFSVSSLDLTLLTKEPQNFLAWTDADSGEENENLFCKSDEPNYDFDFHNWWSYSEDVEFKVMVPNGLVFAVNKKDNSNILWQTKFESPIANAWLFRNGELSKIDLFDERYIPALSHQSHSDNQDPINNLPSENFNPDKPLLYVGMHANQLYIQSSNKIYNSKETGLVHSKPVMMPRVRWKPYIATAPSRTPAVIDYQHLLQSGSEDESEDYINNEEHRLSVWHEQYPYDGGYYLFPDYTPIQVINYDDDDDDNEDADEKRNKSYGSNIVLEEVIVIASLMYWWKEILSISLLVSALLNFILYKFRKSRTIKKNEKVKEHESSDSIKLSISTSSDGSQYIQQISNYQSRFYEDFDQVSCIGKGGFGVVFGARKKIEDQCYAVKRITLQNSEKAKVKVAREVQALAQMDHHPGIVRYYSSWFEQPPSGWQEKQDGLYADLQSTSTLSYDRSITDLSCVKSTAVLSNKNNNAVKQENPLHNYTDKCFSDLSSPTKNDWQDAKKGGSEEFIPYSSQDIDFRESFSTDNYSLQIENSQHNKVDDLSEVSPRLSSLLTDSTDNVDIVFEDSGCADNSSKDLFHDDDSIVFLDSVSDDPRPNSRGTQSHSHSPNSMLNLHSSTPNRRLVESSTAKEEQAENAPEKRGNPKLYFYIQMQLCQKETLKDWLNNNTLNRQRAELLDIFEQIVSAVCFVHQCGRMHRDLKPSNIFFSTDGTIKVGDFGLVAALSSLDVLCSSSDSKNNEGSFTKYTNQVGTKLYMSPEQVEGRPYSHKVDIFSLGLIFFELLYPFKTEMERIQTLTDVRARHFPTRFVKELHQEAFFVRTLLEPDPTLRPDCQDILQHSLIKEISNSTVKRGFSSTRARTISS